VVDLLLHVYSVSNLLSKKAHQLRDASNRLRVERGEERENGTMDEGERSGTKVDLEGTQEVVDEVDERTKDDLEEGGEVEIDVRCLKMLLQQVEKTVHSHSTSTRSIAQTVSAR